MIGLPETIDFISNQGLSLVLSGTTIFLVFNYVMTVLDNLRNKNRRYANMVRPDMLERLVEGEVGKHNKSKLQMIRTILIANHINGREEEIRLKVRNMIERQTMVYIDWFNSLNSPLQNLGDWYVENFDFEPFLEEIMVVVLRPCEDKIPKDMGSDAQEYLRQLLIGEKIDDIANIMLKYQTKTHLKLIKELKNVK